MQFLNKVLLEALYIFKNFQTHISSTRNYFFLFFSIGSDLSKSETVVGHILQCEQVTEPAAVVLLFNKVKVIDNVRVHTGKLSILDLKHKANRGCS